ncbi:hypothetical protein J559_3013 [Acinetobacter sp. 983759]|uniref:hypothetical protein n=1 Tax=Acinetobacter sp. 983759 TaxID=1310660 RepID=UPI00044BBE46|nr:hypothetical protein [Acinetobacter sp. 983759]EXE10749.1 hypothetical protein J559_3268 [Acinetobacter sp. 983759]EXE12300.1 hypothetical protein J559_3145 [Acinetobacter sp. 983759]EXE12716.1 hypothetical protein J559_3013 [Acinetobacter sp. 983759]
MVMKQTQTKMFDFADIGLDFSAGSKSLFPDRFKKMLAQGYNTQTVSSVTVEGNQVTLNYGMNHGYAADRVLKLNTSALADINNGEFVIDSVTTQTVTLTIDNAPQSIAGNFTTYIAPLGWELVYEKSNVHIYKFKHIDESDLYLRICFQTNASHRNAIVVAVGKTADLALGTINDINVPGNLGTVTNSDNASPAMRWDFTDAASSTPNNYTYSQGTSTYGRGVIVGSIYHIVTMINSYSANTEDARAGARCLFSILPTYCFNYENLNYPIVIGDNQGSTSIIKPSVQSGAGFLAYVGRHQVAIDIAKTQTGIELYYPQAGDSILPPSIDTFNTTASRPIQLFEYSTKQFIGFISGGLQTLSIGPLNMPVLSSVNTSPIFTKDIDLDSNVCVHGIGRLWVAVPIEEIKIA